MMNLEIMRQLVAEAESGSQSMPTAHVAAVRWQRDPGPLRAWCYSSNALYLFRQADYERVLRLSYFGDRTPTLIRAELDFVIYLATQGLSAAQPLRSRSGRLVEDVDSPYGRFHAVVFERVPGRPCEACDMDEALLHGWGRMMAQIHDASQRFVPTTGVCRPAWQENLLAALEWLPPEEKAARRMLRQALDWLRTLPVESATYGLIHHDLEPDNLVWDGQKLHVVDFDDAPTIGLQPTSPLPSTKCCAIVPSRPHMSRTPSWRVTARFALWMPGGRQRCPGSTSCSAWPGSPGSCTPTALPIRLWTRPGWQSCAPGTEPGSATCGPHFLTRSSRFLEDR